MSFKHICKNIKKMAYENKLLVTTEGVNLYDSNYEPVLVIHTVPHKAIDLNV